MSTWNKDTQLNAISSMQVYWKLQVRNFKNKFGKTQILTQMLFSLQRILFFGEIKVCWRRISIWRQMIGCLVSWCLGCERVDPTFMTAGHFIEIGAKFNEAFKEQSACLTSPLPHCPNKDCRHKCRWFKFAVKEMCWTARRWWKGFHNRT